MSLIPPRLSLPLPILLLLFICLSPHSEGVDEGAPAEDSDSVAETHSEGDLDANERNNRLHEGSVQAAHQGYNFRSQKPPGLHLRNDYYVNSTKQLTFSKAMKVRAEAAKDSIIKELKQILDKDVFKGVLKANIPKEKDFMIIITGISYLYCRYVEKGRLLYL